MPLVTSIKRIRRGNLVSKLRQGSAVKRLFLSDGAAFFYDAVHTAGIGQPCGNTQGSWHCPAQWSVTNIMRPFFIFTMKSKRLLFAGLAPMSVGIALSLRPYNPERFRTVHEFTVQCHMRSEHFLEAFGGTLAEADWCLHNTGLSVLLYAVIGLGCFLVYRSRLINPKH